MEETDFDRVAKHVRPRTTLRTALGRVTSEPRTMLAIGRRIVSDISHTTESGTDAIASESMPQLGVIDRVMLSKSELLKLYAENSEPDARPHFEPLNV